MGRTPDLEYIDLQELFYANFHLVWHVSISESFLFFLWILPQEKILIVVKKTTKNKRKC